jgi:rod shape-determining protein MreD
MRWFRFAALLVGATILQTSLVQIIAIGGSDVVPDLLLILLVFFATRCDRTDAVITSFTIGFAADLVNPTMNQMMGPQIISFGLVGTLLSDLVVSVSLRRMWHQGVVIALMGFLTAAGAWVLTRLRIGFEYSAMAEFLWQPLYSAIVGPLLFLPVAWLMRMNERRRRRSAGMYRPR